MTSVFVASQSSRFSLCWREQVRLVENTSVELRKCLSLLTTTSPSLLFSVVSASNINTTRNASSSDAAVKDSRNVKSIYKLGFLLPFNRGKHCSKSLKAAATQYAPAVLIAINKVNNDSSLLFNLSWVWNDTMCDEWTAIRQQVWQINEGVDVFLGPAVRCASTSKNAVAFNKPVMSFVSKKTSSISQIFASKWMDLSPFRRTFELWNFITGR